jgi:hypothetical protein
LPLWCIEWSAEEHLDLDLEACDVFSHQEATGYNVAILDCDEETIARFRQQPGVRRVARPKDGETFTGQFGETIVIEGDGTRWREL